jgi:hypothetical protein
MNGGYDENIAQFDNQFLHAFIVNQAYASLVSSDNPIILISGFLPD